MDLGRDGETDIRSLRTKDQGLRREAVANSLTQAENRHTAGGGGELL